MTSLIIFPLCSNFLSFAGGELYSGTVSDFSGTDALIYRNPLRTEQYDLKHLNGKHFKHFTRNIPDFRRFVKCNCAYDYFIGRFSLKFDLTAKFIRFKPIKVQEEKTLFLSVKFCLFELLRN